MKIAFRCCNLWFCMILLCFNPANTIHLFLWEKNAPFGCGVMARLWIQTTGFDVCLWQSLNDLSGHLFYTQRHKWRLKIWFLMAKYTHWFQKTKQCRNSIVRDENACFLVYWNCLKNCFACKLNCLKQSLIWYHFHSTRMATEEFLYPTHCLLKVVFCGYVHLVHSYGLGTGIIYNDSWLMCIKIERFRPSFTEFKCLS